MIKIKEAEKKLEEAKVDQKENYTVIVDGGNHRLGTVIKTKQEAITLAKCKKIVSAVENHFGIKINRIEILMDKWDLDITPERYANVLIGDDSVRCITRKKAIYYTKQNRLVIWQDGLPVYENHNGTICRDEASLADCLC